jgi:hypothetical protein
MDPDPGIVAIKGTVPVSGNSVLKIIKQSEQLKQNGQKLS